MAFTVKDPSNPGQEKPDHEKASRPDLGPGMNPMEPGEKKSDRRVYIKWLFLAFAIIYFLLSQYHAPLLTFLGRGLVLEHPPQKADLIVCLAGGNVERGLAAADAYKGGLAPKIFVSREELPDGYELLKERGIHYPETIDLLIGIFQEMGVPGSAIFRSEVPVKSTFEEAKTVREFVKKGGVKSMILVTSPTHSRRAWLTFKKVFKDTDVRILMRPSAYSKFSPEDWWKKRRYVKSVIIEYQKLIYYKLKYAI
ncbi:MAG: YdcF family protein [Pseudomonadota bacterium]